jgi:proteic killer suppression protein
MIRRFRHKGLERLFTRGDASGVNLQLADKLRRMLALLDKGKDPSALNLPGYRLHQLKGERKGEWAAMVSAKEFEEAPRSCVEYSALGKRRGISRPVQHPDNNYRIRLRQIVDGVGTMEGHAQPWSELLTLRTGQRKETQRLARGLDRRDDARGDVDGRIGSNGEPDFGEVRLGGIGQAEGERLANSFLPRSMMRSASKSFTRPSARSVSPLSMSALRATSSCSCRARFIFQSRSASRTTSLLDA